MFEWVANTAPTHPPAENLSSSVSLQFLYKHFQQKLPLHFEQYLYSFYIYSLKTFTCNIIKISILSKPFNFFWINISVVKLDCSIIFQINRNFQGNKCVDTHRDFYADVCESIGTILQKSCASSKNNSDLLFSSCSKLTSYLFKSFLFSSKFEII